MPSYYEGLFGHFDEPEPKGETIYGEEPPIGMNGEEESESAKQAGEAFDKMFSESKEAYNGMMESAEQILNRIKNGKWNAGGNA